MNNKHVLVCVVESQRAVEDLVYIAGEETLSHRCRRHTVRAKYGQFKSGFEHFNVLHRPKNKKEAAHNLRLFGFS